MCELDKIRLEIDKIDEEILNLFMKRMNLVHDVVEYKKKNNLQVLDSAREKEKLESIRTLLGDAEITDLAVELFENIMKISKDAQRKYI